jgi:gliding motility-associated-like protein
MIKKLLLSSSFRSVYFFLGLLFIFLSTTNARGQCAGSDSSIEICDVTDPSSISINLFSLLGGSPTAGGVWKDVDKSGGFDKTTGILNAQQVKKSGIYHFTYTVTNVTGCVDNTAEVTVTIGGYVGVPAPSSSICNTETEFNLFQVFDGNFLRPQTGGVWTGNTTSLGLIDNLLDTSALNPGSTYSYTYTIPAVGNCPMPPPATVFVTVYRSPIAGVPTNISLCSNELSANTNFDLNSLLAGEDIGGTWTEFDTSEISDEDDNKVDLLAIYNNYGPGVYRFAYTVVSKNNVCDDEKSEVEITIEKQLDFTGASLIVNSDICENAITTATYTATLTQGNQPIPNGNYEISYSISGNVPIKTVQAFVGGKLVFPIERSNFQNVNDYTVKIVDIKQVPSNGFCTVTIGTIEDVLHVYAIPKINSATLKIDPICQGQNATVVLSGISNLTNGAYSILYNLSGLNIATSIPAVINVVGGTSSFVIPANLIPVGGNTTITITSIVNNISNCTNSTTLKKEFIVNPLPTLTNLTMAVNDVCQGSPTSVKLTGLENLSATTITYTISGANTVATKTISLAVVAGAASFTIPSSEIPNLGATTITIADVTNALTGCSTVASFSKTFNINLIPSAPLAPNSQPFCTNDNATVGNLVPNGNQYRWYDSPASTQPLAVNTKLITGNYYVREINVFACESNPTLVNVIITNAAIPALATNGQNFCGVDKPTILSLTNQTSFTGTIQWYDALNNGNLLDNTKLLSEGATYYGFNFDSTTNCTSSPLIVTVSLKDCIPTADNFFIPDGFSPNGDGINDFFQILNIEFVYPNYTIEIFNRYGNVVFKGDVNKPAWDGKNTNSNFISGESATGVYFYIIHYNKDNLPPAQGQLYLNR